MKNLEIMQYGKPTRTIQITEEEWNSINTIDYIELDRNGNLLPEFGVHGSTAFMAMQRIATANQGE